MDLRENACDGTGAPAFDLERVYQDHATPLRRWLTTRTRDADAADDIAQEAFARLTREVRAGRPPDEPGAWLYRVAHNLAASRGRHAAVAERHASWLATPQSVPGPETCALEDETRGLLGSILAELPRVDREAVVLAAMGHRGPEIARHLGRSDGATRTLLCRARARIRGRMLAAGYEPG